MMQTYIDETSEINQRVHQAYSPHPPPWEGEINTDLYCRTNWKAEHTSSKMSTRYSAFYIHVAQNVLSMEQLLPGHLPTIEEQFIIQDVNNGTFQDGVPTP